MLFVLILLISALDFKETCASGELDLKEIVAEAEQAAHTEKKVVDTLLTHVKSEMAHSESRQNTMAEEGRCLLAGCTGLKSSAKREEKTSPLLASKMPLIFVSASMPIESLKRLSYHAKQQGAILVIRGMVNGSMTETVNLVDQIDHPLEIDPKLFERFEVNKVPVFVISHKDSWHKVSGNVELNFVLESVHKDQVGRFITGEKK